MNHNLEKAFNKDLIIFAQMDPKHISFLDKILEAFDGLAILSTRDGKKGELHIHVTKETKADVLDILRNFPKPIEILEGPIFK
jgi:hypothetical protein